MFKLVLEKAEEPEIKLPTSAGSWKKEESSRKTSISAIDYAKAFDFQMSQLFASGGQSIGVSASASVLPMNIQD